MHPPIVVHLFPLVRDPSWISACISCCRHPCKLCEAGLTSFQFLLLFVSRCSLPLVVERSVDRLIERPDLPSICLREGDFFPLFLFFLFFKPARLVSQMPCLLSHVVSRLSIGPRASSGCCISQIPGQEGALAGRRVQSDEEERRGRRACISVWLTMAGSTICTLSPSAP